jgi:uncharacterized protein with GYD domain
MPHYVSLINWTDQGIQNAKAAPERFAAAKQAVEAAGGKIHSIFLTMGEYDLVTISEMPNDEAYATLMLALGGQGNIRTKTLKAFTEDEFGSIVANLPG